MPRAEPPFTAAPLATRRAYWLLLAILVAIVYAQSATFSFVQYDDQEYVFANRHVRTGLSLANVAWAWTSGHAANYHPLTWLSLQLDASLVGPSPGAMHLVNALVHAFNAVLVFELWSRLTGQRGRSVVVAAIFAVHPLRVESVAWVSERKDVLSVAFALLSLLAYLRWTRARRSLDLVLSLLAFAASLLSKPMFVTLPVLLLLLDTWPLKRLSDRGARPRVVLEKLPFVALAIASAIVTLAVQSAGNAVWRENPISFPLRLLNALHSITRYLELTLWPLHLAAYRPHPFGPDGDGLPTLAIITAIAVPLAITLVAFALARRRPILLVGWLWFLIALVPVIGLVQVGGQGYADRYTYAPSIGLLAAIVWLAADAIPRRAGPIASAIVVLALILLSIRQAATWKTSRSLAEQGVRVEPTSALAWNTLGTIADSDGDAASAERAFRRATQLRTNDAASRANLAGLLIREGRLDAARPELDVALAADPPSAVAWLAEGELQFARGDFDAGVRAYERGLAISPTLKQGWNNLAVEFARHGDLPGAIERFKRATELDADYVSAWLGWSDAALRLNDLDTARRTARRAYAIEHSPRTTAAVARASR